MASDPVGFSNFVVSHTLGDFPSPVVPIDFERCGRARRYRLDGLEARFGADAPLPDVLLALAACERRADFSRPCGAWFMDLVAQTFWSMNDGSAQIAAITEGVAWVQIDPRSQSLMVSLENQGTLAILTRYRRRLKSVRPSAASTCRWGSKGLSPSANTYEASG